VSLFSYFLTALYSTAIKSDDPQSQTAKQRPIYKCDQLYRGSQRSFPLGNLHLECEVCSAAHSHCPAIEQCSMLTVSDASSRLMTTHQDQLISNTTVKQCGCHWLRLIPLSVSPSRGRKMLPVWLPNRGNIAALSLLSLGEVIMNNVDNYICVKNAWAAHAPKKKWYTNKWQKMERDIYNNKLAQGQGRCRDGRHVKTFSWE